MKRDTVTRMCEKGKALSSIWLRRSDMYAPAHSHLHDKPHRIQKFYMKNSTNFGRNYHIAQWKTIRKSTVCTRYSDMPYTGTDVSAMEMATSILILRPYKNGAHAHHSPEWMLHKWRKKSVNFGEIFNYLKLNTLRILD